MMLGIGLVAALVACAETLAPLHGAGTGLLFLAPALILALPLLAGRYVGEDAVVALVAGVRLRRRRRATAGLAARLQRAPRVLAVRGARLLAAALAERGPPAPAAAHLR